MPKNETGPENANYRPHNNKNYSMEEYSMQPDQGVNPESEETQKNKQQPNYWGILPASIRYDKELSSTAKLLGLEINSLTQQCGYCYATNKYLGELMCTEPRHIRRILAELKSRAHLHIDYGASGHKRRIYIIEGRYTRGGTKMSGGGGKNVLHNKIIEKDKSNIKRGKPPGVFPRSRSSYSELHVAFEEDLWNNPLTPRQARNGSKTDAYKRWLKCTLNGKPGKRREVREGWERYVRHQQAVGYPIKRLDYWLNPEKELWLSNWEVESKEAPVDAYERETEEKESFCRKNYKQLITAGAQREGGFDMDRVKEDVELPWHELPLTLKQQAYREYGCMNRRQEILERSKKLELDSGGRRE